jgi:competence protein ComFB
MTVHNYAEENVLKAVAEIFEAEAAKPKRRFCTCDFCRTDVACYVLNRVPPLYQTSGRGLAHRDIDYQEKLQREADLVALVYRGIERITETKRPHGYEGANGERFEEQAPEGHFFNYPQILGRLFNSAKFEPVSEVEVRLLADDGSEMRMTDPRWINPYMISSNTPGIFSFWPMPEKAASSGMHKTSELKIAVDAPGFEQLRHYFTVTLVSVEGYLRYPSGNLGVTLPDLFLVPAEGI